MKQNKFLIGFVIVFSILITSFVFYFYQVFFSENILVEQGDQLIVIEEDMDFQDLQDVVYEKGIVNDMLSFSFVAKILDYQENMKPGLYLMKKDMTNLQAVRMLRAGEQIPTTTTFNNVRLKPDLAGKITDNLQADSVELHFPPHPSTVVALAAISAGNGYCSY